MICKMPSWIYHLCKDKGKWWYFYCMLVYRWLDLYRILYKNVWRLQESNDQRVWDDGYWSFDILLRDWDQVRRRWNFYESREVCKRDSQEIQNEGLCKNEYSSWVWSEDVKEWWRKDDKLYNIQKPSWEFEILDLHSSRYSL